MAASSSAKKTFTCLLYIIYYIVYVYLTTWGKTNGEVTSHINIGILEYEIVIYLRTLSFSRIDKTLPIFLYALLHTTIFNRVNLSKNSLNVRKILKSLNVKRTFHLSQVESAGPSGSSGTGLRGGGLLGSGVRGSGVRGSGVRESGVRISEPGSSGQAELQDSGQEDRLTDRP